jgi:lipopolysaccharide/colanic/teichoic acid biosynthesis glycosyltransferase
MENETQHTRKINPFKRLIDIVLAITFMIVFSPIYVVTAIIIWMQDKHTPFYHQKRVGYNAKFFDFYKFRSMIMNADELLFKDPELYKQIRSGNNKIVNDPRITKFGRFIRKYSIDEFPQMLNVVKGDMSIVGPRALRPDEFEMYAAKSQENADKLKKITSVMPGITGYWQVYGRSNITFDQRIDMDVYYADNHSLKFDLTLLIKTPFAIIKGEGAY